MAKHTIINLDKVVPRNYPFISKVDLDNGCIVASKGLVKDAKTGYEETNLFEAVAPTDVTKQQLYFHCSVEMMYDERKVGLHEFYLEAGKAGRSKILGDGDIVQITVNGITTTGTGATTVDKAKFVIPVNGSTKLKAVATLPAEIPKMYFTVEEFTQVLGMENDPAVTLQVVNN